MPRATQGIAAACARAESDVAAYRRDPGELRALQLGRFSDASVRSLLLRRLLLRLPAPLAWVDNLTGLRSSTRGASAFRTQLAYWRRARQLLTPPEWAALAHAPVVLMYHAIGGPGEPASRYIMPGSRFRRQIAWLRSRGYRAVCLREIARSRLNGLPPPHSVVVTFDDGYRDNAPALFQAGIPATIFVVTTAIGGRNCWDLEGLLAGRPLLGWDEARELAGSGIEVGAHTRTHPALPEVSPERLSEEVAGSLDDLRRELGPGDYTFAYPHGRFDERTQKAVAAAGFTAACCSQGGVNDPYVHLHELRRVEVKGTDSFLSFALMVWLGRRITPLQFLRSLLVG